MAESTTITLQQETKQELDEFREDGESWNAFFQRWLANEPPERPGISRVLEAIEQLPEKTAGEIEERLR